MYGTHGAACRRRTIALARCILLWGVNPSATSIHLVPHVRAAQRAGAFVAVIDPRRTPLARTATLHLAPRPGTDVVLALAMIDELVRRGAADHAFLARARRRLRRAGARRGASGRSSAPPRSATCRARDIAALVEAYAAASPARGALRLGRRAQPQRRPGGARHPRAARGGGQVRRARRRLHDEPQPRLPDRRGGARRAPTWRARPVRQINMVQLGRVLTEPQTPPVRALFVYNANPVAMTPDQNRILAGLAREDLFTVVHEQVLTDTARFADVLLPATTVFEQTELHKSYGHYVLQYSEPVIAPVGESLHQPGAVRPPGARHGLRRAGAGGRRGRAARRRARRRRRCSRRRRRCAATRAVPLRFGGDDAPIAVRHRLPDHRQRPASSSCPPALGPVALSRRRRRARRSCCSARRPTRTINSIFGEFNLPQPAPRHASRRRRGARPARRRRRCASSTTLGEVHVPLRVTRDAAPRRRHACPRACGGRSTLNGVDRRPRWSPTTSPTSATAPASTTRGSRSRRS